MTRHDILYRVEWADGTDGGYYCTLAEARAVVTARCPGAVYRSAQHGGYTHGHGPDQQYHNLGAAVAMIAHPWQASPIEDAESEVSRCRAALTEAERIERQARAAMLAGV